MTPIFIAGIDTDVGKTIVTGLFAKYLLSKNKTVITQKIAQTGCVGISEDILQHRKIMEVNLFPEDFDKTTCPFVFKFPASPHLAAAEEKKEIDIAIIDESTKMLQKNFQYIIIEGVGGLFVPLTKNYTTIDFLEQRQYNVILVSTPKLGSINHTLMSIDLLKNRNINLLGIVYNLIGDYNKKIKNDSEIIFEQYLKKNKFANNIVEIQRIESNFPIIEEFSAFLPNE